MSRLFTHHDRLVLFQSSFFTGAPLTVSDSDMKADSASNTPAATPTTQNQVDMMNKVPATTKKEVTVPKKKAAAGGGFAIFIPHFHKIFGLMCILNMLLYETPLYRSLVIPTLGTSRLAKLSVLHVILAMSSFEFKIGMQRNGMYTIYREMQLHTIVFTLRSFTVIMCDFVLGIDNILHRLALVLFWHVAADVVTHFYRPPSGETTIRRAVNGKPGYQYLGRAAMWGIWFFGFSQLVGTFMMITDTADAARMAMFVMTPVQISAFMATLVRKGYASNNIAITIYFLVITPIFFYHHWTVLDVALMACAQIMRFNLKVNKYPMWILLCTIVAWCKGDLLSVMEGQIVPVLQHGMNLLGASAQYSASFAEQALAWSAVPANTVVPAWIYNETFQIGAGMGQLCNYVLAQLM